MEELSYHYLLILHHFSKFYLSFLLRSFLEYGGNPFLAHIGKELLNQRIIEKLNE
jgi:hypothetical protein